MLVSFWGCKNLPQVLLPKATQIYSLVILEVIFTVLRARFQQGWFLLDVLGKESIALLISASNGICILHTQSASLQSLLVSTIASPTLTFVSLL